MLLAPVEIDPVAAFQFSLPIGIEHNRTFDAVQDHMTRDRMPLDCRARGKDQPGSLEAVGLNQCGRLGLGGADGFQVNFLAGLLDTQADAVIAAYEKFALTPAARGLGKWPVLVLAN